MAPNMQRRFNGNAFFFGFLRLRKRGQGIGKKGQNQRVIVIVINKITSFYMTTYIS